MKRVLDWILRPWFLSLVGLGAFSVVLWYIGPFLSIGRFHPLDSAIERVAAIIALLALWSLWQAWRLWRARRNNREILEELSRQSQAPGDETAEARESEIAQIRERFDEAMALLRGTRLKHRFGRQYLYELPWYILIGPPGSGKTTLLRNSGLHFPLAERLGDPLLRGVGGTRDCDWWITDEAVLLDTAGRYTTQDSHAEVDRAAWLEFLRLLKRYRRRRPVNGVLVSLSVSDLLQMTQTEREAHARAIRQRIQELHEAFGIRFPIYFLVTKCDLVAGFMEYFSDLDREGREQVWGMTFPIEDPEQGEAPSGRFTTEFNLLCQRLDERLYARLQEEPDPQRRSRIFTFPPQFASLGELIAPLIDEIFKTSRFEIPPQLRGVYFTSGTQEGSPIDRVMASVSRTFQLDRQALPAFTGHGQSFFITRLLKDLVFAESGLAGTNLRLERQRQWLVRATMGLILAGTLGLAMGWLVSYYHNRAFVSDMAEAAEAMEKQLAGMKQAPGDLLEALPVLDRLRFLAEGGQEDGGWHLGLDQHPKLMAAARRSYERGLENLFLPHLLIRLEEQLGKQDSDPDFLYEALRVYLMFHMPEHFDAASVREWVSLDWKRSLPRTLTVEQRDGLRAHLDAALAWMSREGRAPLPPNEALVKNVRSQLARIAPDKWIFRRIAASRLAAELPAFDPVKVAGPDAALIFRRASGKPLREGVAGFFTVSGYRKFSDRLPEQIRMLSEETWVLGQRQRKLSEEALVELELAVRRHYANAYIEAWEKFLRDLRMRPFDSLNEAREVLRIASSPDSPLKTLVFAIAEEVRPGARTRKSLEQQAREGADLRSRFESFFGSEENALRRNAKRPIEQVDAKFEHLSRQVGTHEEPAPGLKRIMQQLDELYLLIDAVHKASERGENALKVAQQQAQQSDIIQRIQAEADRLPAPLRQWLNTIASSSNRVIGGEVLRHVNLAWQTRVLPFCRKAIANRYPLRRRRLEITLEDFSRFFAPDGIMDSFFREFLAPFVDTGSRPWRLRNEGTLSESTLRQFERAAAIRDAFFGDGGRKPNVGFSLEPVRMDSNVRRLSLDIGGQKLEYRHGPPRSQHFTWPTANKPWVRLQFEDVQRKEHRISFKGTWAWFRLIDASRLQRDGASDRYRLTFSKDGLKAEFRLQADSVINPFRLSLMRNFQCPEQL